MTRRLRLHTATEESGAGAALLPGLRPGVVLVGDGDEAELRDMRLGQVVKLGGVATTIVRLLNGKRTVQQLLGEASNLLGGTVNPSGLIELLEALDRRALLDTPRARTVVEHGLVRADIAALRRLTHRRRQLEPYDSSREINGESAPVRAAADTSWECKSCNHCCSEKHLLGPVTEKERDRIIQSYTDRADLIGMTESNFLPIPGDTENQQYILRTNGGHCVYLGDDGLCRIHAELGEELKPSICRMFPFRGVRTSTGWDMGMSLSCPTVANGGRNAKGNAQEAAEAAIAALRVLSPALHQTPADVVIDIGCLAPYSSYKAWEQGAFDRLEDESIEPTSAWLQSIRGLYDLVSATVDTTNKIPTTSETLSNPALATTVCAEAHEDTDSVVAPEGIGAKSSDPFEAADQLLGELALWSELLIGLEAANPTAIRRFRSGVLRLRLQLGVGANAAPVLAEAARLENRESLLLGSELDAQTEATIELNTDFRIRTDKLISGQESDVQRRFLRQNLYDKRNLEFSTVARGAVSTSLFLALLALPHAPGDEMRLEVEDIAYLSTHPQLIDVLDTRASTRRHAINPALHFALMGRQQAN